MANCRTLRVLLYLVSMRQIILLHLVCDNMSHPPSGGLYLVSMWHNVAPPAAGYYILCRGPRSTYHILCQCDKMSHRPAGGTISSGTTSCAPFGGNGTTYSGATKCRADLRSAVGGTTSSGLASLGILHLAPPFGRLRGSLSMRHNVAPPAAALVVVFLVHATNYI